MTNTRSNTKNEVITSFKDYMGNTVYLGDEVIYYELRYRYFKQGKIIKITPQKCYIEDEDRYKGKTLQFHDQVIGLEYIHSHKNSNK